MPGYEPVTLTTQMQPAGACTTNVCAPSEDCAVTDCPDGPVSLIAGVPVGADPAGVTNTWNDGPEAGAGVHRNAQPMFQPATVVVNVGLVQLPWSCVGPMRTRAGPAATAAVDGVVDPPAAVVVVVVEPPPAVVEVLERPATAVVVVDAFAPPEDGAVVVVVPPALGITNAGVVDVWFAPTVL